MSRYLVLSVISVLFVGIIVSCSGHDKRVEEVLSLSGSNRHELEQVLEHYRDSTLKLEAARFLIANMVGFSVPDTASLVQYIPFYQLCDSLRHRYKDVTDKSWIRKVDSLWKVYPKDEMRQTKYVPLMHTVTARQLIAEIDLAFRAWKENAFTRDCPFDLFCEYILPFCCSDNFVLDDSRIHFNQRHKGRFYTDKDKSITEETDSLLYSYKNILFSSFSGLHIPILNAKSLEQVGGGLCPDKGNFNILLLSALGMPVTMDFVPAWGNRDESHSWNVLVTNDSCYAFDPFWTKDNWKYNRLYSNTGMREFSGRLEFRAPKIYRKTYSTNLETTLLDKGIPLEDIPPLFRHFKKKDVSAEYFETVDVEASLNKNPPEEARFAYLCVYSSKGWVPVQFGKIQNGKAIFRGMGKNIIYLPAYYKNGTIIPAGTPFLLTKEGEVHLLEANGEMEDCLVIRNVAPEYMRNWNNLWNMRKLVIAGRNGTREDTLRRTWSILPEKSIVFKSDSGVCHRFIRLRLFSDTLALRDLSFYTQKEKIRDIKIMPTSQLKDIDGTPDFMFDDFVSTGYIGEVLRRVVDIDLGKEYRLTSIMIAPYLSSQIFENSHYELMCWKDGWKSLEVLEGEKTDLIFRNVPRNVMFRLKQSTNTDRKIKERIFLYKDGEILWM